MNKSLSYTLALPDEWTHAGWGLNIVYANKSANVSLSMAIIPQESGEGKARSETNSEAEGEVKQF